MSRYRRLRRGGSSLARRRRRVLLWKVGIGVAIVVALVGGLAALSHIEALSISHIEVRGASSVSADEIRNVAEETIAGSYPLFFSRSNILSYPFGALQRNILAAFPRIKSVSATRANLTTLDVAVSERSPFAVWCGENYLPGDESVGSCYFLDEDGFIFMKAPDFTGPVFFRHFGAIDSAEPVGASFIEREEFKNMHFFLAELEKAIKRTPNSLALIDDIDVEVYLDGDGKVVFERTQDLGRVLQNARAAFASNVLKNAERPLEYVDLRFGNKAYYRFKE